MAIEAVVEEVATNLEEVAQVTRQINTQAIGYFGGGLAVGALVGFYIGFKLNRASIKAEAYREAEEELKGLREIYQQKLVAQTNTEKPSVEAIVERQGYTIPGTESGNPTSGNPAQIDVHITTDTAEALKAYSAPPIPQRERPLPAPVPILDDLPTNPVGTSKSKNAGWNYPRELESRSANSPYVIHQDEFVEGERGYTKVTYTYYAPDDVLVDEADEHPVPHGDLVVGQDNLKFGHGTDDVDVVFVRNDRLEIDIEICRTHKSYEEEALGMSPDDDDS